MINLICMRHNVRIMALMSPTGEKTSLSVVSYSKKPIFLWDIKSTLSDIYIRPDSVSNCQMMSHKVVLLHDLKM